MVQQGAWDSRERFNDLGMTTQSPKKLVALIILQNKYNLQEALESYYVALNSADGTKELQYVRARALTLFADLKYMMEKDKDFKDKVKEAKDLSSEDDDSILAYVDVLFRFLYKIDLTKIDVKNYDRTDAMMEDEMKGL